MFLSVSWTDYTGRRSQLLRGSFREGSLKTSIDRKITFFLINVIEINPVLSNFTAIHKIWSKQGSAHRAPKFLASIQALPLLSSINYFSPCFSHIANICLIFCQNLALFSDEISFDANILNKLDRINSVHTLSWSSCIYSDLFLHSLTDPISAVTHCVSTNVL